jgi:hypothetical protein
MTTTLKLLLSALSSLFPLRISVPTKNDLIRQSTRQIWLANRARVAFVEFLTLMGQKGHFRTHADCSGMGEVHVNDEGLGEEPPVIIQVLLFGTTKYLVKALKKVDNREILEVRCLLIYVIL